MAVKRGYKQTEVGVIPEDWNLKYIENLAYITTGSRNTQDRVSDGLYPFFVRSQTIERINSYSFDGEAVLTAGDGVGTGKVFHYINGRFDTHQRVYRISDFNSLINGYFFFLYFSNHFYSRIMQMTAKSSVDSVRREMIARMPIPLPPKMAEQEAIAEALSDADALIESLEQLLVKKCQIKQGAMQELLTGRKRLPDFTGEWQRNTLSTVIDALYAGVSVNSIDEVADIGSGDLAILKTSCVDRGVFIPNENKRITKREAGRARLNPRADTILISRMNTIDLVGECGYVQRDYPHLFVPDRLWMTEFKQDAEVSARWLSYILSSKPYRDLLKTIATGTSGSMKNIAKGSLLALEVSFPSLQEQCAISTVLAEIDAAIEQLELKLTKARRLKQGMMQELLTGRIRLVRPSAQTLSFPAKESASAADISHNTHFNEAVVIAMLSAKFGSETFPLGRFRRTKFSYLLHRHVEHEAAGFMKKAAGPYNPQTRYGGAEKIALQNRYVRVLSTGKSEGFVADENIAQAEGYFDKWYGVEALTWLEQFRYQKNDALELLTTVDMACQDLSQAGKAATLSAVKQIIHDSPEWKAKLNRAVFSDDNIATTIQSCGQLFPIEEE